MTATNQIDTPNIPGADPETLLTGGFSYGAIFSIIDGTNCSPKAVLACRSVNLGFISFSVPGADPGFQGRGVHLKKLHRAEGGAKNFGVFRVKNHDFMQKKSYLFPILAAPPPGSNPCEQ